MSSACPVAETYEEIRGRQKYIPFGFQRENVESSASIVDFNRGFEIESNPNLPPVPVWRVHSGEEVYETAKPISVKFKREGDFFFAENEQLCVIGTGESPDEAVTDLGMHIIHFYNHYKKLPSKDLTVEAKQLKKIYEGLFTRK